MNSLLYTLRYHIKIIPFDGYLDADGLIVPETTEMSSYEGNITKREKRSHPRPKKKRLKKKSHLKKTKIKKHVSGKTKLHQHKKKKIGKIKRPRPHVKKNVSKLKKKKKGKI